MRWARGELGRRRRCATVCATPAQARQFSAVSSAYSARAGHRLFWTRSRKPACSRPDSKPVVVQVESAYPQKEQFDIIRCSVCRRLLRTPPSVCPRRRQFSITHTPQQIHLESHVKPVRNTRTALCACSPNSVLTRAVAPGCGTCTCAQGRDENFPVAECDWSGPADDFFRN